MSIWSQFCNAIQCQAKDLKTAFEIPREDITLLFRTLKQRIQEQEKVVDESRNALRARARQGGYRIRHQLTSPTTLVVTFLAGIMVGLLRGAGSSQPARSSSIGKVLGQLGSMLGARVVSIALQSLFADPGDNLQE